MRVIKNVVIDSLKESDIPTLVKWGQQERGLWVSEDDRWYSRVWLRRWIRNPEDDVLLAARVNGALAGMCLVHCIGQWGYCSALYVDGPYRKVGIGTMLLKKAHQKIVQKGVHYFSLLVKEDNVAARSFYKKRSFREGFHFVWMYRRKLPTQKNVHEAQK